jgi:hypothetical protein
MINNLMKLIILILCLASVVFGLKINYPNDTLAFGDWELHKKTIASFNTPTQLQTIRTNNGGRACQVQLIDTFTVSTAIAIDSNMVLDVMGRGFFKAAGGSLTINGKLGNVPNKHWLDTSLTVVFASGSVDEVRPEWWGARGDSVTDCAVSIRKALVAARGAPVKFSTGKYLINTTISMNSTTSPKLIGMGKERSLGTVFYCKNITGYTFELTGGTSPEAMSIEGFKFDGANGAVGSYTNSSTTWVGAYRSTQEQGHFFMNNCVIERSHTKDAKAINLTYIFYSLISNTEVNMFSNGYCVYNNSGISTTHTFTKCYFHYSRQCVYERENSGVTFNDVVFESSLMSVHTEFSRATFNQCYWENMGYDITGTGLKKGLSVRFGRSSDTIQTFIYDHNGQSSYNNCVLGYNVIKATNDWPKGWFEGSGVGTEFGWGGLAQFNNCFRGAYGAQTNLPFFYNYDSSGYKTRTQYKYVVYDGYNRDRKLLRYMCDIRNVDIGTSAVNLDNGAYSWAPYMMEDWYPVDINGGKLTFRGDNTYSLGGQPYKTIIMRDTNATADSVIYPFVVGDNFISDSPSVSGYKNSIVVSSGVDANKWRAVVLRKLRQLVVPTTYNGKYYKCVTAGCTRNVEPTWTTSIGDTIVDSTTKWICEGTASQWMSTQKINNNDSTSYNKISVMSSTSSTSTTTGALVVSGGVGVAKTLYANKVKAADSVTAFSMKTTWDSAVVSTANQFWGNSVSATQWLSADSAYLRVMNLTGKLITGGGRIVKTTRITTTPYSILSTDHHLFIDTDGSAITVNLPAGIEGTEYIIYNVGSSGKNVTIVPNGSEKLLGTNTSDYLTDGENITLVYNSTEGWR